MMVKQRIKKDGFPVIFNEMLEKAEPIRWENSTDRWMKIKLEDLGVRAISGRRADIVNEREKFSGRQWEKGSHGRRRWFGQRVKIFSRKEKRKRKREWRVESGRGERWRWNVLANVGKGTIESAKSRSLHGFKQSRPTANLNVDSKTITKRDGGKHGWIERI